MDANRITKSCTAPPRARADDDPQGPREVAELSRQDGADERSGSGDGGEVVAEDDPFVGGLVVMAVAQAFRGRGALVVEGHDARGDEAGVETVSREVSAGCRRHQPEAVDRLATLDCDDAQTHSRGDGDGDPDKRFEDSIH